MMVDFNLLPQWRVLRGVAHGLKQSTMLGTVQVRVTPGDRYAVLDDVMRQLIDDPLPESCAGATGASALVMRFVHWTGALQRHCKIPICTDSCIISATRSRDTGESFFLALPYFVPQATATAGQWVARMLRGVQKAGAPSLAGSAQARKQFDDIRQQLSRHAPGGVNGFHFYVAAQRLGIQIRQILPGTIWLGTGCESRWLSSSFTDQTSSIGVTIARDKAKTAAVLRLAGLPAPLHARAKTASEAADIACRLGFPVVVKPADCEQGAGVAAGLRDAARVVAAFEVAYKYSKNILVEKHVDGEDYRLTVLQGRVIKVENRRAGGVTGDGHHTIAELVQSEQQTPRLQRILRERGKMLLELDEEAIGLLAERGLGPESVPADGNYVCLRRKNNVSTGGTQLLVPLERVHPDNIRLAQCAAEALMLDLAGVDLLIPDISKSWIATGALICEVNAQPQIGTSTTPDIYVKALQDLMGGQRGIPIHLIIRCADAPAPGQSEVDELTVSLKCNGLSAASGLWVDGQRCTGALANGYDAALALLINKRVRAAVCVMSAQDVIEFGLPADRFVSVTVEQFDRRRQADAKTLTRALSMLRAHTPQVDGVPPGAEFRL